MTHAWRRWAAAFGFALLAAGQAWAADPVDITWDDLLPERLLDAFEEERMLAILGHPGGSSGAFMDPAGDSIDELALLREAVPDYDGRTVRLAGFVVPLDFEGTFVREFLLVPYIGACIHVPPPPPNQIVYVYIEEGVEVEGLFDPVVVTGVMSASSMFTDLADVGYRMVADEIAPYDYE